MIGTTKIAAKIILLFIAVILVGCVENAFKKNLAGALDDVEATQKEVVDSAWASVPSQELAWSRAVEILNSQNLELRRSRERRKRLLGEREHFVWRQLNPRVIAYVNLNAILGDLSALSSQGVGASLLGSVNVPDPLGYYARRYALELQYYQMLLDEEMLRRKLQASLYAFFLKQNELRLEKQDVRSQEGEFDLKNWATQKQGEIRRSASYRKRREGVRVKINTLLNTPLKNWQLKVETLPSISYAKKLKCLDLSKGFARIAVYQLAFQVEMVNARLWQVKFTQAPQLSAGVGLPRLYDMNNAQDFSFENVGLFTSLNYSLEFTGRRKRNVERAKVDIDYMHQTLKQRLEREFVTFEQRKLGYKDLLLAAKMLREQLAWMSEHPPESGSKALLAHVNQLKSLKKRERQTVMRLRQIELRFWVWDDEYWGLPF